MKFSSLRTVTLALALLIPGETAAQNGTEDFSLGVSVAGLTRSGSNCHVSFQVRNRLLADILQFTADFKVLDGGGAPVGEGIFAAGRIRRLQPYQRVASFEAPGDTGNCGEAASIVIEIRDCVLDGTGDVGAIYCREAFVAEDGMLSVALASETPTEAAQEVEIAALGFRVSRLTSELARTYRIVGATHGLVVTAVENQGKDPGLREGDLIIEVSQNPVDTVETLEEHIRAARNAGHASVLCMVFRDGERHWLVAYLRDG